MPESCMCPNFNREYRMVAALQMTQFGPQPNWPELETDDWLPRSQEKRLEPANLRRPLLILTRDTDK